MMSACASSSGIRRIRRWQHQGWRGLRAALYLSEATVKSHIARILAKLGLRDRVQVAVYAYEQGIVRPGHRGEINR
jgi:hypothetical protein